MCGLKWLADMLNIFYAIFEILQVYRGSGILEAMNDQLLADEAIEQIAKDRFGLDLEIRQMIAREIPIGHTGDASVFLSKKKQLYAYIHGQSNYVLGDIQKIVARMGLRAELYIPPKGQPHYFDDIAAEKFTQTYPGRKPTSENDLRYYKTLASYNPALVVVHEVKNGEIKQFDTDASSGWRTVAKFAYRRIKTS